MITFKPVVYAHQKRKDNTYNIKIRVTFKGVHRHLPTTLFATPNDLTRSLKLKDANLLNKANHLIGRMRSAVADLSPFDIEAGTVDDVVRHIRARLGEESFHLDFFEYAGEFLKQYISKTREGYITALNSFRHYLGGSGIDINEITHAMMLDYMDWVNNQNKQTSKGDGGDTGIPRKNRGTATRLVSKLARIYESAKLKYNDDDSGYIVIPRSPFSNLPKEYPASRGQKALPVEVIQEMIEGKQTVATSAFLLSLCLMGANLADLYEAKPVTDGEWVYHRRKTRTRRADGCEMRVRVPACAERFISVLQEGGQKGWWLPALHIVSDRYATKKVNYGLRLWAEQHDVPVFTFYAARHSFATLARRVGVEKATIDECLSHLGDYTLADIYAERDWDRINEANEKVLALFRW